MLNTQGYKHTILEFVIFTALLLQQWLHICIALLHDTFIVCLVETLKRVDRKLVKITSLLCINFIQFYVRGATQKFGDFKQKALRSSVCRELKQQARNDTKFISISIRGDERWLCEY